MPWGLPATVLVVDDEQDIAELAADLLEREGFVVVTAANGRRALSALDVLAPVAIVLDMMMPEMDGLEFLEALSKRSDRRPPVLATSAFEEYLPLALASGASATLRKPYGPDALVGSLSALLRGEPPPPQPAPALPDDAARLRAILDLRLLEPDAAGAMDGFVRHVARLFDVPIALVSIVTADRQYWHSMCGLPPDLEAARGTPRSHSFCAHAIVARSALIVQDAARSALFRDNPLVRERGLRFYAGVPLFDRLGNALGTLCLLDFRPRTFGRADLELLSVLAKRVDAELEWRERRARSTSPVSTFRHLTYVDEELGILGRDAFVEALHVESLRRSERGEALVLAVLELDGPGIAEAVGELARRLPGTHLGRLGVSRIGLLSPASLEKVRDAAEAAGGPRARVSAEPVPRILGGADVVLWSVEAPLDRPDSAAG
jgi:CheY-like chemotaxis protein